jgi:ubiquinone/menaquinone biosynthesis C-methylase UbiE
MTVAIAQDLRHAGLVWSVIESELKESNISVNKDSLILYLGCGCNAMAKYLTDKYRVVGIDLEDLVDNWSKFPQRRFIRADALRLPFSSDKFDLVYTLGFFDPWRYDNQEHYYTYAKEIKRVLKPGGVFAPIEVKAIERDLPRGFTRKGICGIFVKD